MFFKKRGMVITAILLFITTLPAFSQNIPISINQAVGFFPDSKPAPISTGNIHIIAAMVDFQRDENPYTTGDGSFHLEYLDRDDIIIDPLPHDRAYFEAHLTFAKNYFERVSSNQISVTYQVLPRVYTMDFEMASYSPLGLDGSENYKLGNLARDTWQKAFSFGDLNFTPEREQDRTMFIIFHAGAGRDIELLGTSLYKTPQDIPSVFMGLESLGRLLDAPDFQGFPSNRPDFYITNTAILPQTESRAGEDFFGNEIVLQLGINGMLTANIGSFLGLPDLFNTNTGQAGIGRFGLMDGASIFSYMGMFPPEPSAWEKIHLGWAVPFDIDLNDGQPIELPAVSMQKPSQIARHHISRDEYFLVENRHRDPFGTGLIVTIRRPNGTFVQKTISPGDERFNPFNTSAYSEILEPGVVIDISNFDFSLPGGPIAASGANTEIRVLNGGMLIWHIDEAVIRSELPKNKVNANPNRRGVRLVEADGAQQIGRDAFGLDTGRYINGHAFDFWWSGNDFTVVTPDGRLLVAYENKFGPDSQPNNKSNNGSHSYFEFFDFSDIQPQAYFYARKTDADFAIPYTTINQPESETGFYNSDQKKAYPFGISGFGNNSQQIVIVPKPSGYEVFNLDNSVNNQHLSDSDFSLWAQPLRSSILVLYSGEEVRGFSLQSNTINQIWDQDNLGLEYTGFASIFENGIIEFDNNFLQLELETGQKLGNRVLNNQRSAPGTPHSSVIGDLITGSQNSFEFYLSTTEAHTQRFYTGVVHGRAKRSFYVITDGSLFLISDIENGFDLYDLYQSESINWPAMADFTHDEKVDFIFVDNERNELIGLNQRGAILNNFPVKPPAGKRFAGTPLLADLNGDGRQEIIIAAQDSLYITLHAYNHQLKPVYGFPLTVGSVVNPAFSAINPAFVNNVLVGVGHNGELHAWTFPDLGEILWPGGYGPHINGKVSSATVSETGHQPDFFLLNKKEVYNWPNPATETTQIRFETTEPSDITVTVINMSGARVAEFRERSLGLQPQEITVNTGNWGNGVYYARVQAKSGSRTETELIKIVVIR